MIKGKKIAIVTGATGGLGREFVRLLLKEKNVDEIWALARNEKKLSRLKDKFGKKIKIYSIDLSSVRQIKCFGEELHEEAGRKNLEISYLVNNAGFAKFCSYGDLSVEESLNMMHVNMDAVVAMGLVIDMICIPWFSTFNVADIFITFGAIILVLYILIKDKEFLEDKPKKSEEPRDEA